MPANRRFVPENQAARNDWRCALHAGVRIDNGSVIGGAGAGERRAFERLVFYAVSGGVVPIFSRVSVWCQVSRRAGNGLN